MPVQVSTIRAAGGGLSASRRWILFGPVLAVGVRIVRVEFHVHLFNPIGGNDRVDPTTAQQVTAGIRLRPNDGAVDPNDPISDPNGFDWMITEGLVPRVVERSTVNGWDISHSTLRTVRQDISRVTAAGLVAPYLIVSPVDVPAAGTVWGGRAYFSITFRG